MYAYKGRLDWPGSGGRKEADIRERRSMIPHAHMLELDQFRDCGKNTRAEFARKAARKEFIEIL